MKHIIGVNVIVAMWLVAAPIALGLEFPESPVLSRDLVAGFLILGSSLAVVLELPGQRVYALVAFGCGLWLTATPFVIGFRGITVGYDVILGALVMLISAIETWRLVRGPVGAGSDLS